MTNQEAIEQFEERLKTRDEMGEAPDVKDYLEAMRLAIKLLEAWDKIYKVIKTEINPYGKPTKDYETGLWVMNLIEKHLQNSPTSMSGTSDLISRQAAIEAACEGADEWDGGCNKYRDECIEREINNLPSASQPDWIPCTPETMPKEPFGCLVTVWDSPPTGEGDDFENILPYFVGWDGEQWNDSDGEQCPFEVIAWMPLPAPYRPSDTHAP